MEPAGKVAVVTGAASGIGRALARRLAAEGAQVVVGDLDGPGAEALGREIGGAGLRTDASRTEDLEALLTAAPGPVDLFCANAGVGGGVGLSDEAGWDLAFEVNVRAHVRAAQLLVPQWLERGSGYFLATASAAGLVTQIGAAPYAVTKHAAVAFAEWLSISYGGSGVGVSCLCPMGVETPMLDEAGARAVVGAAGAILEPDEVAEEVIAGLRRERFLILPHPQVLEFFRRKASDYDRWLAGMRRLQATLA